VLNNKLFMSTYISVKIFKENDKQGNDNHIIWKNVGEEFGKQI
jgi:hypothetical protein